MGHEIFHILIDTDRASYEKLNDLYAEGYVDDSSRKSYGTEHMRMYPLIKYTEEELAEMADSVIPVRAESGPIERMYDFTIPKDVVLKFPIEGDPTDPLNMALANGFETHKEYSGRATLIQRGELGRRVNLRYFTQHFVENYVNSIVMLAMDEVDEIREIIDEVSVSAGDVVNIDPEDDDLRRVIYDEVVIRMQPISEVSERHGVSISFAQKAVELMSVEEEDEPKVDPVSLTTLEACRAEVLKIWGIHVTIEELQTYVK